MSRGGKLILGFAVEQRRFNGVLVARFASIRDASKEPGVPYSQIYACVNGMTRKAAGYVWRKVEEEG